MTATAWPRSLIDNPRLDGWIDFSPPGKVRLKIGKVEIGQGVLTALAQIAAEELDVSIERVSVSSGDTEGGPNELYTAGSLSIEQSGGSVRLVCAEIRQIFLQRLATELGCDARELAIVDGRFLRGQGDTGRDYWQLAPRVDLARQATGTAPVKPPSEFRVIGRNVPRLDLPAKIAGAPFIHDLRPEGLVHARVLRSSRRGARLAGFDEGLVRRAGDGIEIVRQGEFVAFASTSEIAAEAALAAARRTATWTGGAQTAVDAATPKQMMAQPSLDRVIEIGKAPAQAPTRMLEAIYSRPYLSHASIGLCCALARLRDGRLEVTTHSQGVFPLRAALARVLGLDVDRIVVRHQQGAGCYGHNGADDVALDAALVALRMPGRPVRVQWTREDELSVSPLGPAMTVRIRAGLDAAARPLQWTLEIWSGIHARRPSAGAVNLVGAESLPDPPAQPPPVDVPDAAGGGATRNAVALYDFPFQHIVHHMVPDLPVRTSALRALGAFANVFAIESCIDEIADVAGADPVAYRLSLLSDPRGRRVIETAAAMCSWRAGAPVGTGRAMGLGFARYKGTGGYAAVVVEVAVEDAVRMLRAWCAADGGLIINPDGATNQIEGGIIQAASWTLKEEVRFADGGIATLGWETYPILRFTDVPEIDVRLVEATGVPSSGLGEVAQGPTAAAIGNAVARALGIRVRDLPLTRERIVAAILATQ